MINYKYYCCIPVNELHRYHDVISILHITSYIYNQPSCIRLQRLPFVITNIYVSVLLEYNHFNGTLLGYVTNC